MKRPFSLSSTSRDTGMETNFSVATPGPEVPPAVCANCGCADVKRFCPDCGQENHPSAVPLQDILGETLGEFFKLDARLWTTLKPLMLTPGFLTVEYLNGRRMRYIAPLKLYFSCSFVYFLLFSRSGPQTIAQSFSDSGSLGIRRGAALSGPLTPEKEARVRRTEQAVQQKLAGMSQWFAENISTVTIFLIPIYALVSWTLYRRRRRLYVEHLVFVAHLNCFTFLLGAPLLLFGQTGLAQTVGLVALPIYQFFAARRVYGPDPVFVTIVKTIVFVLAQFLIAGTIGAILAALVFLRK